MTRDLTAINEEIDEVMKKSPSMDKYQRLGILFVCKQYLEEAEEPISGTVAEILTAKAEQIGEKSTLKKLEPILSQHLKDLEMIAPTISGNLIKQLKEI